MAKKPTKILKLKCAECKGINYLFKKTRKAIQPPKLELKKYCKRCKKHTTHKESK